MTKLSKYAENIHKELKGMHELGMLSNSRYTRAYEYVVNHPEDIAEWERDGCTIANAADLVTYL